MQDSYRYFLVAASELNITRAASKLYISQQCLSEHIHKLEKKFNTKLFNRSPRLSLTPAGETFVRLINQIDRLESSFLDEINEDSTSVHGTIRLGIVPLRSANLIASIFPAFYQKYPNVTLQVDHIETVKLHDALVANEIDLFVGLSSTRHPGFEYISLVDEHPHLIISDKLLSDIGIYEADKPLLLANGISLEQVKDVPFVLNTEKEELRRFFDRLAAPLNDNIKLLFSIDQPNVRLALCAQDLCVTLLVTSMLHLMDETNQSNAYPSHLNAIPIICPPSCYNNNILAYPKNIYIPKYERYLIDLIRSFYQAVDPISSGS